MKRRSSLPALLLLILTNLLSVPLLQAQEQQEGITARRFARKMNRQNSLVLDVRTPEEFKLGHLEKARNIDVLQEGFVQQIDSLDRNLTYLLYCRSGKRSQKALELMKAHGFNRVYQLKGGIEQWPGRKYQH